MTVLGKDTFSRANQSGFGTASDGQAWSLSARGTATWGIASNEGTAGGNIGTFNIFLLGSKTPTDCELLGRITPVVAGNYYGLSARYGGINSFYYADFNSGTTVEIGKDNAGTFTTIASASFAYSAGTAYWIRFRLVGINLSVKVWADGSAEPNTWNVSTTDSTFTSGQFGFAGDFNSASNTLYDSFYAVDYLNCENLSVSDSFLSSDSALLVEANSASDSFGSQSGYVPVDSLSTSDSLLATDGYSTTDGLSALDVFLSQGGATWVEVNTAADSFSGGGTYLPTEGLSISDSLLANKTYLPIDALSIADMQSALQSWNVDALSVSDSFATIGTYLPVEALSAIESLLASDTALLADLLSIVDSFTGVSGPPGVLPGINITFVTRDGKVGFTTRDGKVVFLSRDEKITWNSRG